MLSDFRIGRPPTSGSSRAFSAGGFVNFLCPNFAISKVAKRSAKYLHSRNA